MITGTLAVVATLVAVGIVIVLGIVVAPYLRKKGIVKEGDLIITSQMLQIIQLVIGEIKMDDKTKDEATKILSLTKLAVGYVQDMMSDKSVEEQQKAAVTVVLAAMDKMQIEITDDKKSIVETSIKAVIK